ncbi:hypothetical protein F5X99DRAFT_191283 [Biscogniauxia marginata]|nr:hypothetical protein F5X99DRAFT_191283 [Biscogniauxia marginata]
MQHSQEAINPHLLLHSKTNPEPPDSHHYHHVNQPQQHMLGEMPYLHYASQPSPPSLSLTPSSRAHDVYETGRETIEARYKALMRSMLAYQQMRIRAAVEPQRPQHQSPQEETLFSSFSLPPQQHHHHHQHLEYDVPSSFYLPPPAEPTIIEAVSQAEAIAPTTATITTATTTTSPLQDQYHQAQGADQFGRSNEETTASTTTPHDRRRQQQKPSRISRRGRGAGGGLPKPVIGGSDSSIITPSNKHGRGAAGIAARPSPRPKPSSSGSNRSKPRPRPRPRPLVVASAVQFALEELSSSDYYHHHHHSQNHHHHQQADPTDRQPSSALLGVMDHDHGRRDVDGGGGDGGGGERGEGSDDDGQIEDVDLGMDLHVGDASNLVLECFVSSMSGGLG